MKLFDILRFFPYVRFSILIVINIRPDNKRIASLGVALDWVDY